MRPFHWIRTAPAILAIPLFAAWPDGVWAQAPIAPAAPLMPSASGDDHAAVIAVVVLGIALIAIIGGAVKLFDLKQQREAVAVSLQAEISDALLRDPMLFRLPITVTAHVPLWRGSPAMIEVRGQVPAPTLREAALRLVEREVGGQRVTFRLEDRIMVLPPVATHAA